MPFKHRSRRWVARDRWGGWGITLEASDAGHIDADHQSAGGVRKTVELMPIVWRLGTGRTYLDYPRGRDLATVAAMGTAVVPLLTCWMEEDCKIMREGAAATLARLAPMAVPPGGLAAELATLI